MIESGAMTSITKKITNQSPSILDMLNNRKRSDFPVIMGIDKFVFVLEHRKVYQNVGLQNGNFIVPIY